MQEIRKKARERVKNKCRVCPVCNGVSCAGDVPGMGGIGTGASFQNNVKALAAHRLVMRVLHEANDPDSGTELFGQKISMPLLVAPVGSIGANMGTDMTDETYTRAVLRGCKETGTLASVGDLPNPDAFKATMSWIEGQAERVIPFIKPWGVEGVIQRLEMAAAAGCKVCGSDVDAAGLTILRRAAAPVRVRTPKELEQIVRKAHDLGMKFIVKGIMAVDEAIMAADAGADGILVSNHGGRVIDHTPGAAEVLPGIAEAVGNRTVVMVDGGIRTGADVVKAIALGAKCTLVCRPICQVAHGDEEKGVGVYLAKLQDEIVQTMRLTGCANVAAITRRVIC